MKHEEFLRLKTITGMILELFLKKKINIVKYKGMQL